MISKYIWLIIPLITIYLFQRYDYHKEILSRIGEFDFFDITIKSNSNESNVSVNQNTGEQIFTSNELKKYTNLENGLYLSILGQVFDVTKGAKHYGPNAAYHVFTGRDASLAFITGDFDENGLTDDISSLSVQQVKALNGWVKFYNENYIYKGKLKGRYFDENGTPTVNSHKVQEILSIAARENSEEELKKRMFPPCNIEWNPESGTRVWCSNKSGGIQRDWIGVPRMMYENPGSHQYRCACVQMNGIEHTDMNKAMFRQYKDCEETSNSCTIEPET